MYNINCLATRKVMYNNCLATSVTTCAYACIYIYIWLHTMIRRCSQHDVDDHQTHPCIYPLYNWVDGSKYKDNLQ